MYNPIHIDEFRIYDIFHNTLDNIVIVSPWSSKSLDILYKGIKFDTIICPHKHTLLYVLKDKLAYTNIIELNIDGKNITTEVNKYPDFQNEILMTTMVYNEDNYIRQWIKFHKNIGVDRFIIYDNSGINDNKSYKSIEKTSDLENVLEDFIHDGLVILVKWTYPKKLTISGISGQSTRENHSIWAFKTSKYIGMFDIDEYVNIQTTDVNIESFFFNLIDTNKININDIGSFSLFNKFFYNPDNLPTDGYNFLKIYKCDKITLSGREKNFVIPKNTSIYCVHKVLRGKRIYKVPHNDLYFNHYFFLNKSNRGKDITELIDRSIIKHTNFLEHIKMC